MGYLYDMEGRLDKKVLKVQSVVEQLAPKEIQNHEDDMPRSSQNGQTKLSEIFRSQSGKLTDVQNVIIVYIYDFEMRSRSINLLEQISNLKKRRSSWLLLRSTRISAMLPLPWQSRNFS